MSETWEVHALHYAERKARTRADSFIFDDDRGARHAAAHVDIRACDDVMRARCRSGLVVLETR